MKAIITQFHGPTNCRGSRIRATEPDGKYATVAYNHALNGEQNHAHAARQLCERMGWSGRLNGGSVHRGYVWVFDDARYDTPGTVETFCDGRKT